MAFVVYLGALTVAGFLIVQQVASDWAYSIGGGITARVPLAGSGAGADSEVSSALDILRAAGGVASAKPVFDDEKSALPSPWLDGACLTQDLLRRNMAPAAVHLFPAART